MSGVSTSTQDKYNTLAHLVNTAGHHISHTLRHLEQVKKSKTEEERKFNLQHLEIHANGAAEHIQKIINHLKDNYPNEAKELAQLEATIPETGKPEDVGDRKQLIRSARDSAIKHAAQIARGSR